MSGVKVLVIGGTGMLGAPVTHALAAAGHHVTALVRRESTRLPAGVTACLGDVFDAGRLATAMEGQEALYLNLATQPNDRETDRLVEREGLALVLAAARTAGVGHVLALSPLVMELQGQDGFDWWVFRVKRQAERSVLDSGMPATVFRASSFMENLNGGMRRGKSISVAGKALHPTWYLAGADLGRMVARALTLPPEGQRLYIAQGPEALLPEEAARRFVAAFPGEALSLQKAPLGVLRAIGLFSRPMGFVATMLGALNRYPETFRAQPTWDVLGPPTLRIEDYARSLQSE